MALHQPLRGSLFLWAVFSATSLLVSVSFTAGAEVRNLSKYDDGGTYDIPYRPRADMLRREGQVRDFVWREWRNRRRGRITAAERWIDAGRTLHLIIEPGTAGQWCAHITVEHWRVFVPPPGWKGPTGVQTEKYEACQIERVEVPIDPESEPVRIPANSTRDGESYHLIFKAKSGETVLEF
jgi:hypothetical protein